MKIAAGCLYYGACSPSHMTSTKRLIDEQGIPLVRINGCAYREMGLSFLASRASELGIDCLVLLTHETSFDAAGVRRMAECSVNERVILSAEGGLHLTAIPVPLLERIQRADPRALSSDGLVKGGGGKLIPIFSPWRAAKSLETVPIVDGLYASPDAAFFVRSAESGIPTGSFEVEHVTSRSADPTVRTTEGDATAREIYGMPNFTLALPAFGALDVDQQSLVFELERAGMRVVELHNCPHVDLARSILTAHALADESTEGIFFLDHDIIFTPSDVMSLCREAKERRSLVAGAYCMRKGGQSIIGAIDHLRAEKEKFTFFEGGEILPASYTGLGFAAVPRSAFEVLDDRHPTLEAPSGLLVKPFFALDSCGDGYAGEDVSFCARLREAGYPVAIDTRVRIFHRGKYDFGLEDTGFLVPRYRSFEGTLAKTREEMRDSIRRVDSLAPEILERTLGVDESATEIHPIVEMNERVERETAAQ